MVKIKAVKCFGVIDRGKYRGGPLIFQVFHFLLPEGNEEVFSTSPLHSSKLVGSYADPRAYVLQKEGLIHLAEELGAADVAEIVA